MAVLDLSVAKKCKINSTYICSQLLILTTTAAGHPVNTEVATVPESIHSVHNALFNQGM